MSLADFEEGNTDEGVKIINNQLSYDYMINNEIITSASYEAAKYDAIIEVPNKITLEYITGAGLGHFLPQWLNFANGTINPEKLEQKVRQILQEYNSPQEFNEREGQTNHIAASVHDLNYLLVKEIIAISPSGEVNPLVYKLSTARVCTQIGMPKIREIYDEGLGRIRNPPMRKYLTFIQEQVLQTQQRFVNELPMLEAVLPDAGMDLSTIDIGIFGRVDRDGEYIRAPAFL